MTQRVCKVEGCEKPERGKGLCIKHYHRLVRYGNPLGRPHRLPNIERFWSHVDKSGACWIWTAGKNQDGYGQFWADGHTCRAHRWIYEQVFGVVGELVTDHLCRNRSCVNPEHIELVTSAENTRRGLGGIFNASKSHCPKGHPYSGDNLIIVRGGRQCRECKNSFMREYYRNNKRT